MFSDKPMYVQHRRHKGLYIVRTQARYIYIYKGMWAFELPDERAMEQIAGDNGGVHVSCMCPHVTDDTQNVPHQRKSS